MQNEDLRAEVKTAGVRWWRIAEGLGLSEFTLSRRLRHELPEAEKGRIREIVRELTEGGDRA